METKICRRCNLEKELSSFYYRKDGNIHRKICKECISSDRANYYSENREDILANVKEYASKPEIKEKIRIRNNKWERDKRKNDPIFKLQCNISNLIYQALKDNGATKKGQSVSKYLSSSYEEYRNHLENLFSHPDNLTPDGKVWMSWDNWKPYNHKTWDDNDPATWTWNIDHIIPQSDLPFSSMENDAFKQCWSIKNLRPYSAKQNLLDGTNRTRHKKK
jgi:hypothetical protein